ncbi:2'-5' RNA ligase family protein [Janibacter cremeus]|uniref:2'-5' RNA ligase n=1 Tax=Janibacter cremeus TaxID=1285192 RepID=A0A852VM32_9MICO|nr:2'-5' RNA ligase [Janibacter cremeus]
MTGHTVLQLPVPALEDWVRERTRGYDAGFVSADPRFGHAHVTALSPFAPAPSATDLAEVGRIAAATPSMPTRLVDLGQFPNGVIHLRPEPDGPLRALTEALVASFPHFPPYEGRFGRRVDPHLTLDAASPTVSLESTRRLLGDVVPVTCTLTRLQLAWWESGRCHVMHEWPLGRMGGAEGFPPPEESINLSL